MAFIYIFPDPTVQHGKYGNWLLDHLCSLWRLSQGSEIFGSWSASSLSAVRQHSTSLQPVLLRHTFRSVVWCNWGPVVAHKKAHCNRVPYLHMFSMNLEASNKHGPWWQDAVPQDGSWNAQSSEFPTHPHKLAIHYILCYDIILYAVHAIWCNMMQYDAIWCNMMQYDAICVVWVLGFSMGEWQVQLYSHTTCTLDLNSFVCCMLASAIFKCQLQLYSSSFRLLKRVLNPCLLHDKLHQHSGTTNPTSITHTLCKPFDILSQSI